MGYPYEPDNLLDAGVQKIFGPSASFWPKSTQGRTPPFVARRGDLNPVAGADTYEGVFDAQGIEDQFARFPKPTAEQEARDADVLSMLGDPKMSKDAPKLSSAFDLKRLGEDLASGKIKNAPGLADQVVGSPKPSTKGKGITSLATRDLTGEGLMTRDLPAARNVEGLSGLRELPAAKNVEGMSGDKPGGGGVEVQDAEGGEEKPPRDWGNIFARIAVGAGDLGNAFGNPRAAIQGGGYQMAKDRLQQQQVAQLKQRHGMWDQAYTEAQQLPPEVLTNPEFASLAQAKAALEKDMMDGKIDNEKNVSTFLTEKARFGRELEQLGIDTKAQQQLGVEAKLAEGRAAQEAQQTQKMQEILANPTAYSPQEVELARLQMAKREQIYEEDGQQLMMTPTQKAQWDQQKQDRADRLEFQKKQLEVQDAYRRYAADASAGARADARDATAAGRRAAMFQGALERSITRRMQKDDEGNPVNAEQAFEGGMLEQMPQMINLARQMGIEFLEPDSMALRPEDAQYMVAGQRYDSPLEAARALYSAISGGM